MELSELVLTRLVIVGVVLAVIVCFALAAASTRRRVRRFEALARSLGAAMVKENKFHYRFTLEIDGRPFDVRYQHIGGASSGGGWTPATPSERAGSRGVSSAASRSFLAWTFQWNAW